MPTPPLPTPLLITTIASLPSDIGLAAAVVLYMVASILLFVFGANLISFAVRVAWNARRSPDRGQAPTPPAPADGRWPMVTVQLPVYNELYVSERIIEAACALDYPSDRLEIQVLDDSTDETRAVIAKTVASARADGINIVHMHRSNRTGYKAGALAEGMKTAAGEFIAIFDADFVPPVDFLRRTVPHFDADNIAFVQARWGHINRDFSWLTRLQALAIDGHFMVEQSARGLGGYWFNFNGTCGIWRTAAIEDAGGWKARTLTEDLDLSYRAHLKGWRARYLEDLVVPGEVPAQLSSFRRQQHRWARGSMECAMRLLPSVWRADIPRSIKFQASTHLMAYGIHLLLLLHALIYPVVVLAAMNYPNVSTLFGAGYLFALTSLAPFIFFIVGQRQSGRGWIREIPRVLLVTVFGSGLMVNTARAALQIRTKPNPEFERTAKFGLEAAAEDQTQWASKRYQLDIDRIVFAEVALAIWTTGSAVLAWRHMNWGIFVFAMIFSAGLYGVTIASAMHALAVRRSRSARNARVEAERATWELAPQP